MIKKFRAFVIAGLLAICHMTNAQTIAVQANINLIPPYTLSLHDYTQPGSNKLTVNVLLTDLNVISYQARLRFTIEGSGFTLTTRANYIPPAITLQGGIPAILGPTELEGYFLPENLDFNGLDKASYLRTRKLPEGFYRFYVEVLDYNRGSVVSNRGTAIAFIVLNEPPLINLPQNNTKLPANDPQNILFNWAPRHLGSPNSAFTTQYEFRLYEVRPKGRNPYEIVKATQPIYEAIPPLTATSMVYNVAMPALIPGNQYAFTVRAVDKDGRDLFKNDGYSEVYTFTWGDECKPPAGIKAEAVTGGGIDLKWNSAPAHTGYNIQYRTKGSDSWYTQNSFVDNTSIDELPEDTEIEYQVQSVCGGYLSDYSEVSTIKTKLEEKREFSCGSGKGIQTIANTNPKKELKVGDQITAGGYTAKITKISGGDGTFSGECNVQIPFFKLAKVPHKFENIKINELNQMYEGKLVSIYNPDSKFVARIKGSAEKTGEEQQEIAGDANSTSDSAITVQGEIQDVHTNSTGQLVIVTTIGDSTVITPATGEEVTITDSKGNQYASNNGKVEKVDKGGAQVVTKNNTGDNSGNTGSSGSTASNNTSIGKDHKSGDEVQFGPLKIKFNAAPQKEQSDKSDVCTYKVESTSFELRFEDKAVGPYKTNVTNAQIKYSIDCTSGALISASIDWSSTEGLPIKGIGCIDALLRKFSLKLDETGKLSGLLTFDASLNQEKSLNQFVYVKKGVTGSFKFQFDATANNFDGSFNMEGLTNLNVELRKGGTVIASMSNGTIDSKGFLTADYKLNQPVVYTDNKTKVELKKFDANITTSLLTDSILFNSIDGEAGIKNIPGTNADLKIKIKDSKKKVTATATSKDNELFRFYGFALGLEKLQVDFTKSLDVLKIEGTDITASYTGTNKDGNINGNITISHFLIKDGTIKEIKGTGNLAYPPYAEIKLENGTYVSDKAELSFSASLNLKEDDSKLTATVNEVRVSEDGKIKIGEVSLDLITTYGPFTIEFKSAPKKNKKDVMTADAKVSVVINDAGVNEKMSFETKVDYKKTDEGFTYLKTDLTGLKNNFPDVYGIKATLTGMSTLYEKSGDKTTFSGKVTFSATLTEDQQLNPILRLRKGLSGEFVYSFDNSNTIGTFDLTSIKGLNIDLMKANKAVATLSGSISKTGIVTGRFKLKEDPSFVSTGFTVTLKEFDVGAKYDLKKKEFKMVDGSGKVTITNISGVTGSLAVDMEYKNDNFTATVDKGKSEFSVCGMVVSDLSLEATMDSEFNFTKIKGDITAKHSKFNSAFKVKSFLIENGELKSFQITGNAEYAGFKFTISEANYKNEELTCSAKVLLSDNFVAVDKFVLHKNGDITIGNCEVNIKKSIMSLHFKSSLTADRFTGKFDATLAKKLSLNGTVDIGTKQDPKSTYGAYSYGYYQLTVGAPIPVFPGIVMSKLGGQFGYNYALDYSSGKPKGSPAYGNYVAGLSFGIQDNAGMAEFAIDPAVFQWGNSTAQLDLNGTLTIPKTSPIIQATAHVKLNIPSYNISGNVIADVKIPSSTGKIFKANATCNFNLTGQTREISVPNISANVLNVLTFKGNFRNTQNFDKTGALTTSSGELNGELSYKLAQSFKADVSVASLTGNFNFNFLAGLKTSYTNQGLNSALIYGRITSNGSINVEILGKSVVNPYYSIDANAKLEKKVTNWMLSANYDFEVGIQSLGSCKFSDSFQHTFE